MVETYLTYQDQYYNLLKKLIESPEKKVMTRNGEVNSLFFETMRINLKKEFPLMEIKKIKFSNVLHELLWFISGNTNIKYLYDNKCNIWNDDAYRYYLSKLKNNKEKTLFEYDVISKESFLILVKNGTYGFGDLDKVYGYNWRNFNGKTDQLLNAILLLKTDPHNRRILVSAHNPSDIEENVVGLPACHNMFQFYVSPLSLKERIDIANFDFVGYRTNEQITELLDEFNVPKYKLNLWYNVRSQDIFLGNPYNVASYSILLHIVAKIVNMVPNEITTSMIDCHLYNDHIEPAKKWIERYENHMSYSNSTLCKSKLILKKNVNNINKLRFKDFELIDYNPYDYIYAKLLT